MTIPLTLELARQLVREMAALAEERGIDSHSILFDPITIEVLQTHGVDPEFWRLFDLAFHWWNDLNDWAECTNKTKHISLM